MEVSRTDYGTGSMGKTLMTEKLPKESIVAENTGDAENTGRPPGRRTRF